MPTPRPTKITLAPGVVLVPVQDLAATLNMSGNAAHRTLKALRVPLAYIGKHSYFLQQSLEEGLFCMLELGGPGFLMPGSQEKLHGKRSRGAIALSEAHLEKNRAARSKRIKEAREMNQSTVKKSVLAQIKREAKVVTKGAP